MRWVDQAACADTPADEFFVEAGRVIDPAVLAACKSCPVRRQCTQYAYDREFAAGYFGGFSPGERKKLTVDQALAVIDADTAVTGTPSDATGETPAE